jgi:hypothetical protein
MIPRNRIFTVASVGIVVLAMVALASAETLRVVTYNIDADTNGAAGANAGPGLSTVLQAIGNEHLSGNAQPIDVLALEELYGSPATTLQFVVNQLNGIYGAGAYAFDTTADPTDGNFLTGNGPSGLIYNTHTVMDLGAVAIGSPSSSGAPRDPMRFALEPIQAGPAAAFYMYVSHAKSGTTSSDATRRNVEANELRTDALSLGPNAHIIYAGDFNVTGSSEAAYQTMISAGVGKANDTANPANNWTASASFKGLMTETATAMRFRDDFQFVSGPMLSQNGLQLVPGSYTVFGNNNSTAFGAAVNTAGNIALGDLPNRLDVLNALTTATDHLPVVADYQVIGVPEPSSFALAILAGMMGAIALRGKRGQRDRAIKNRSGEA